jgi:hypothetical protein
MVLCFGRAGLTEYLFRGRTQVEAGSRTVLGIGPGKSPVASVEVFFKSFCTFPRSTSRVGQPSDGTPPVTLDVSYKILIHIHLVDLTTRTRLLQHFTNPYKAPISCPAHSSSRKKVLSKPSHTTHTPSQYFLLHSS